jgi:hypothetical protein
LGLATVPVKPPWRDLVTHYGWSSHDRKTTCNEAKSVPRVAKVDHSHWPGAARRVRHHDRELLLKGIRRPVKERHLKLGSRQQIQRKHSMVWKNSIAQLLSRLSGDFRERKYFSERIGTKLA